MNANEEAAAKAVAAEIEAALAPVLARHKLKYVVSAALQKETETVTGVHFLIASHPDDPMWAVISLARSAQVLKPAADAQMADRLLQETTRGCKRISVDVDELDEHGSMWAKYPELFRALDRVRVHDVVRLTMAEARITPYGIAYDQDARVLHVEIPEGAAYRPEWVAAAIETRFHILAVVGPGATVKVTTM